MLFAAVEIRLAGRRQRDGSRLSVKSTAVALRTLHKAHVLFELSPPHRIVRFAITFEQFGNEPVERAAMLPGAASVAPFVRDVSIAQPVQKQPLRIVG